MSVVIIGGNECMTRQSKELCGKYNCKAKVYPKAAAALKNIGKPDLLVLFTGTISHKMVRLALSETKGQGVKTEPSHTSSAAALKSISEKLAKSRSAGITEKQRWNRFYLFKEKFHFPIDIRGKLC